jgi:choice-of-anchor C domain-containing protein
MRRWFSVLVAVALCAAVVLAVASASGVPVVNGGFETPADGCVAQYNDGSSLGGWLVGPGNVDHVANCLWATSEGSYTVDLNASDTGGISQQLSTTPSTHYQLHYALAGNMFGPPAVKTMSQKFGTQVRSVSFDTTGTTAANPHWICPTYPVVAPGRSTTLSFTSTTTTSGNNWFGPVIDDVKVLDATAPTVTRVIPQQIGQGAVKNLTVYGTNFVNGAGVSFSDAGISVGSVTFVSATRLTVHVSVSGTAPTTARDVTVTNPDASTDTCGKPLFVAPAPKPTSASPSSAARGATLDVHVLGSDFVNGATVAFGAGVTVNSVSFVNSGDLSANVTVAPGATVGARTIIVRNPDGGAGRCIRCFGVT